MPRISAFFGIVIAMDYDDHSPPHFHARYGEHEALIEIDTAAVLRGRLPRRALAMVIEWTNLHHHELLVDWDAASKGLPLAPIPPLD